MHSAHMFLPQVPRPKDILTFLNDHFDLVFTHNQNPHEPIQATLCALAPPTKIEALEPFNPTALPFIHGIGYAFQRDRPLQLRKAAVLFLPLVSNKWFNAGREIMDNDQLESFCTDWADAVDHSNQAFGVRIAALMTFFGMIDSPDWRPHIIEKKWELLKHFESVPQDYQPMRRCIHNRELAETFAKIGGPAALYWSRFHLSCLARGMSAG